MRVKQDALGAVEHVKAPARVDVLRDVVGHVKERVTVVARDVLVHALVLVIAAAKVAREHALAHALAHVDSTVLHARELVSEHVQELA